MKRERLPIWGPFLLNPMQDYNQSPLIFVVGRPRSGTNFIRSILNLHSKVWISGEPSLWIKGGGKGVIDLTAHLKPFDSDDKFQQLFQKVPEIVQEASREASRRFQKRLQKVTKIVLEASRDCSRSFHRLFQKLPEASRDDS